MVLDGKASTSLEERRAGRIPQNLPHAVCRTLRLVVGTCTSLDQQALIPTKSHYTGS